MTIESMMDIISRHNLVVEALSKCDIKVKSNQIFKAMSVWHKLACEGSSIVSAARNMGIDCKIDMQGGEIVFEEKGANEDGRLYVARAGQ